MRVRDAVRRLLSAEDAQDASAEVEVRLGGAVMEVGAEVDDCLVLVLGVEARGRLCGRSLGLFGGSRRLDICVCVCVCVCA
jgi:hypothetical protein